MSETFIRARSPEQKTQRHVQFLNAARGAVEQSGLDEMTMADIARAAGVAPSAFYRYYKSKEEILAHLLIAEADEMTSQMQSELPKCGNVRDVATSFASICAKRPLFCDLASDLARILERNIQFDRLVVIKKEFARVQSEWSAVLSENVACLADLSREEIQLFLRRAIVVLAGLWPVTQTKSEQIQRATSEAGLSGAFGPFCDEYAAILCVIIRNT